MSVTWPISTFCQQVQGRLHQEVDIYLEATALVRAGRDEDEFLPPVGLPDERDEPCEGCAGFGKVPAGLDWQELTICPHCGGAGR